MGSSIAAVRALIAIAAALLVLAAACSNSGTAKDASVDLQISVWPDGKGDGKLQRRYRLRCNPLAGNLPHGDRACYLLVVTPRPFAPVPPDAVCTQVYGGPEVAHVRGRVRGRSVDATFSRADSCQTDRWERASFLFPVRA
jgi:hypothetical protein